MRIWVLSDLHVDVDRRWELPPARPAYDVMIVAGDLTAKIERGVKWLRERVTDRPVIYLPGNHEPYGGHLDRTVEKARAAAGGTNICVMQSHAVVIRGVRFVATTLWTDFGLRGDPELAMRITAAEMNDYKRIRINKYERRLRPHHTQARHHEARAFIEAELARPFFEGPTVVATHHAVDAGAGAGGEGAIAAAYASDLTPLIEEFRPALWVHGHIHRSADRVVGRTRVVSNAKGYSPPDHNPDFDPGLTIEI
jgi:hypothetical protein